MLIDVTTEPMGPGIPFIVSDKTVEGACKIVDNMYVDGCKMRVYQMPDFDGTLNFLILHVVGIPLPEEFVKSWHERNVVDYIPRQRKARG